MLTRANIMEAIRFWEVARLPYNLLLALIVLIGAFATGERWEQWLAMAPTLLFLAVAANLAYCAAYPIDLAIQLAARSDARRLLRFGLWGVGAIFAALIAVAMLYGMFGFTAAADAFD
ncbi:MAG: hypothetical protein JNJ73_21520 [Hyphomonadaceae bacterium]|nr:hypothetical protein [Hyphomonadaceae bacterium]